MTSPTQLTAGGDQVEIKYISKLQTYLNKLLCTDPGENQ